MSTATDEHRRLPAPVRIARATGIALVFWLAAALFTGAVTAANFVAALVLAAVVATVAVTVRDRRRRVLG